MLNKLKIFTFILLLIIVMLVTLVFQLQTQINNLEQERKTYQWNKFTCDVLLAEPKVRAIMCVRKFKRKE